MAKKQESNNNSNSFDYELSRLEEVAKNLSKRKKVVQKILSAYAEFKNVDPNSIEAQLICQAITQMSSAKAGAAARKYVDEKARLYAPVSTDNKIIISFWNPLEETQPEEKEDV